MYLTQRLVGPTERTRHAYQLCTTTAHGPYPMPPTPAPMPRPLTALLQADPIRVLRAARMAEDLGLAVHPHSEALIRRAAPLVRVSGKSHRGESSWSQLVRNERHMYQRLTALAGKRAFKCSVV